MNTLDLIILIGIALIGVASLIYLIVTKQWAVLRETAYRLMLRAEKILSEGAGAEKFALVFTEVYSALPPLIRLFVREEDLRKMMQDWYDTAMDWLDDGDINGSREGEQG
jgi:hypothetical protein